MSASSIAPFFIIGCPRSGTTLLQVLLDAHPNIAIPPESHIFERFPGHFKNYGNLENDDNLLCLLKDLLSDIPVSMWHLGVEPNDILKTLKSRTPRDVIDSVFTAYCRKTGKGHWGDKTPQHAFFLNDIVSLFPHAKFIFLVRDGRDVAESTRRVYIGPQSMRAIAGRWKKYINLMEEFLKNHHDAGCMVLHYEDLVKEPENAREVLLSFLGEVDGRELSSDTILQNSKIGSVYLGKNSLHSSLNGGVSKNKIGIYKKRLASRDIETFEYFAGPELLRMGYEVECPDPEQPTFLEYLRSMWLDYGYRYFRKFFTIRGLRLGLIQIRYNSQYYRRRFLKRF